MAKIHARTSNMSQTTDLNLELAEVTEVMPVLYIVEHQNEK